MRWASVLLLAVSCGIGEPDLWAFSSGTSSSGTGGRTTGGLTAIAIWTSDSPLDGVEQVYVTFDRVELRRGSQAVVLLDRRRGMNLLELQNGIRRLLADGLAEPGTYNELVIRLAPGGGLAHFVEADGNIEPLFLAPGAKTEFVFDGPFRLRPDEELELQLDFNVLLSVFEANGTWYLAPNGSLHDPRVAAAIEGTALPAGTTVSAQLDGREVASTTSGPDGYFRIFPLRGDRYDLLARRTGYVPELQCDIEARYASTTGGFNIILRPGESSELTGFAFNVGSEGLFVRLRWNGSFIGVAGIDPVTGRFSYPNVPAGSIEAEIWDARGPLGRRELTLVSPGIDALLEFK
ncbi:MAG: DUF4382 domain-containing protein [Planctomycetota bacterium]